MDISWDLPFEKDAAYQSIFRKLQNTSPKSATDRWIIKKPVTDATQPTNPTSATQPGNEIEARLAAAMERVRVLGIIAYNDLKVRSRHLCCSNKGVPITHLGNAAAHSGDVKVDVAHFLPGKYGEEAIG